MQLKIKFRALGCLALGLVAGFTNCGRTTPYQNAQQEGRIKVDIPNCFAKPADSGKPLYKVDVKVSQRSLKAVALFFSTPKEEDYQEVGFRAVSAMQTVGPRLLFDFEPWDWKNQQPLTANDETIAGVADQLRFLTTLLVANFADEITSEDIHFTCSEEDRESNRLKFDNRSSLADPDRPKKDAALALPVCDAARDDLRFLRVWKLAAIPAKPPVHVNRFAEFLGIFHKGETYRSATFLQRDTDQAGKIPMLHFAISPTAEDGVWDAERIAELAPVQRRLGFHVQCVRQGTEPLHRDE